MKFLRFIASAFILTLIITIQTLAAPYVTYKLQYDGKTYIYTEEAVYLKVNGEILNNLTMPPVIMNGNTLVPAREVFEKLGARVAWKNKEQEVDILYNNIFVVMHIDKTVAVVAGKTLNMSVAPKIINNKTMIPLRFVSEAVGLEVGWDKANRTATVDEPKPVIAESSSENTTETTTASVDVQETVSQQASAKPLPEATTEAITETTTETTSETAVEDVYDLISTGLKNKTSVTGIHVPLGNSNNFVVSASSALSDVKVYPVKDNKLTIDILNAENMLNQSSYSVNYPSVSSIVVSQYLTTPDMVTRIVMTVDSSAQFDVKFSDDKTSLIISFEQNSISKIGVSSDENGNDIVSVTVSKNPPVNMSRSSDNTKIIADFPYSSLNMAVDVIKAGNFIDTITYSQYSDTSVRVVLNLKNTEYNYKTSTENNVFNITVGENIVEENKTPVVSAPTALNTNDGKTISLPTGGIKLNTYDIEHIDNYTDRKYTLILPGDYSSVMKNGTVNVDNEYLNSYTVETSDGKTKISISEKKIMAYDVTADSSFVYIKPLLPKEKYKNIVVLDAGHGGDAPGTINNGYYEKDITLDIINRLVALFDSDESIKVYATRTSDVNPGFRDRTNLADEVGDIFISVHINSAESTQAKGTEVFHYNGKSTPSGLSSEILANKMQEKLLSYLGTVDRKVKPGDLFVIRETYIPAVLCEIGFLSNPEEAAKLGDGNFRQKAAQAIYDGCKELFEIYPNR